MTDGSPDRGNLAVVDAHGADFAGERNRLAASMTVLEAEPISRRHVAPRQREQAVPRLTLTPEEAAAALGVSRDFFDAHVKPELRVIRRGRLVLIPVRELERWTDENAASVLA